MVVAIIGAMEKEVKKLIEDLSAKKEDKVYISNINNNKIIICESGIGKVNSSIKTQYIIDKYNPKYIISTGCCGSLKETNNLFDIIISKTVTYHDFFPERIMRIATPDNGDIKSSDYLIEKLEAILKRENIKNYHLGKIATGDHFVTSEEERDKIYNYTRALGVDMESASIGHTAKANNIEFISIRTISDFSNGIDEEEEKASNISVKIVEDLIKSI